MKNYLPLFFTVCSFFAFAQESTDAYDVFLIAGQSNTLNGCCKDPAIQKMDDSIMQLGRYGEDSLEVILAKEPLDHHDNTRKERLDRIGFAMTFAKLYKETYLEEGRKILLIPTGHGGTGFIDGHWNPGDDYYEDAIMRVNYVFEKYPNSELKAILWQQGEKDVMKKSNHYKADLDTMIVQIRRDIKSASISTPFFMGGMVPYWVSQKKRREVQQKDISQTPKRHLNVWYVSPHDPFTISKKDNDSDMVHYDAKGQIELGKRYFTQYQLYLETD